MFKCTVNSQALCKNIKWKRLLLIVNTNGVKHWKMECICIIKNSSTRKKTTGIHKIEHLI